MHPHKHDDFSSFFGNVIFCIQTTGENSDHRSLKSSLHWFFNPFPFSQMNHITAKINMCESKWKCPHCVCNDENIFDGREKTRFLFFLLNNFFTFSVCSLIRMNISCFHVAINIPFLIMTLNIDYSYHIQVKGNTWDKLSPLIVIIIAWCFSIRDGILGFGAGGGGGAFSSLSRPWVERTKKTLWIKSVTSSQEKSSRHSKFWGDP